VHSSLKLAIGMIYDGLKFMLQHGQLVKMDGFAPPASAKEEQHYPSRNCL
jgi:hypothetical protein